MNKKPDFDAIELIPAIIQDINTKTVLMLGYMNEESFEKTILEKKVTFYSRSKRRLWTKGEKSGNFLEVVSIALDCDNDTILIKVNPLGPTCHTGSDTCFNESNVANDFLLFLETIISSRKKEPLEDSYTSSLFKKGINKITQKMGEEAVELIIEAKDSNTELFLGEAADLLFHYLVLLHAKDHTLSDVLEVLKLRHKKI